MVAGGRFICSIPALQSTRWAGGALPVPPGHPPGAGGQRCHLAGPHAGSPPVPQRGPGRIAASRRLSRDKPWVHPGVPRVSPSPGAPHFPQGTPFPLERSTGPLGSSPRIPQGWMNTPEFPFSGSAAMQGGLLLLLNNNNNNNHNNNNNNNLKVILECLVAFPSAGGWLRRWHCATREVLPRLWGVPSTPSQSSPGVQAQLGLRLFVWALPVFSRSHGSFFPLSRRPPGNGKP